MSSGAKRQGRGPLLVISAMLLASGLLRLGAGAGQAFALQPGPPEQALTQIVETPEVLAALQSREQRLKVREDALSDRMQALNVAESEARKRISELVAAEEKLAATIALANTAAEDDLLRLTEVYQTMKPKDASALFEEMAPEFAAGFLSRMKPESAAAVMAGLTPRTAYAFSVLLAGRNASVPKQ